MAVINSTEYFLDDSFGLFFLNHIVFGMNKLLEVVLIKVKYYFKVLFDSFIDDVAQGYNIWMLLEVLKSGNLSQSSRGDSLVFVFELDVFDGDKVIGFLVFRLVDFAESPLADD
jgi:hypothetical protein